MQSFGTIKQITHLRNGLRAREELAVILYYLATEETTEGLMFQLRLRKSIISQFKKPVFKALFNGLTLEHKKCQ